MTSKKLKILSTICYDGSVLNEKRVFHIADYLKREDLKKFIKELKVLQAKKNVIITLPSENYNKEFFETEFPNKNIVFKYDPGILVGVRIEYNDNVYDFNLKSILEKESSFIRNYYD
jgi:hypothetical protein